MLRPKDGHILCHHVHVWSSQCPAFVVRSHSRYRARKQDSEFLHRAIFCAYWLYFYGFRGVLGRSRLLDYVGMAFPVVGLLWLQGTGRLNPRVVGWVTVLLCPVALAAILYPNDDVIPFVFKTYLVALYFTGYFKAMRPTLVEFACFAVPAVVSVYFLVYPRSSDELYLLQGRRAGISEPNFTSLSLIYAMCGALAIYVMTGLTRAKVFALLTALVCSYGVILTASRAGFAGAMVAFCLFLLIEVKMRYVAMAVIGVIIAVNSGLTAQNKPLVVQRLEGVSTSDRSFTKLAWDEVCYGEWFIGGSPKRVTEWSKHYGVAVPHNSILDLGLAFGKASFYFYAGLLVVLLVVNVRVIVAHGRCRNNGKQAMALTAMLFLSLLPMYMFLSAGLAMDFILWMVLGAYPLLDGFPRVGGPRSETSLREPVALRRLRSNDANA